MTSTRTAQLNRLFMKTPQVHFEKSGTEQSNVTIDPLNPWITRRSPEGHGPRSIALDEHIDPLHAPLRELFFHLPHQCCRDSPASH